MTTEQADPRIVHAHAHGVVPMSIKRRDGSPYAARWPSSGVIYAIYANRLHPVSLGTDALADYWTLRRGAVLYDVPEKPLSIEGPDAVALLERVLCRRVADLGLGRARYAVACDEDGGILMDGVLIRLSADRFWYVQADGEIENWLRAHAVGRDVEVGDPSSRVLQIQGPKSLDVLAAATGSPAPEDFRYFHARTFDLGGQEVLISRTGFTGEVGIEIYGRERLDHLALWDHLMASGEPYGLIMGAGDSMGPRRIEAGILDNVSDIDRTMTPFAAGLGALVDFANPGFIGREALERADRRCLLFGLESAAGTPGVDDEVHFEGRRVGRLTIGEWSPTLERGIGYVRFDASFEGSGEWLGRSVTWRDRDGADHDARVVRLPFFDADKRIPRGLKPADPAARLAAGGGGRHPLASGRGHHECAPAP